jgi:hypothetical protein
MATLILASNSFFSSAYFSLTWLMKSLPDWKGLIMERGESICGVGFNKAPAMNGIFS